MDRAPKWQAGKAQGVLVIQDVGGEDAHPVSIRLSSVERQGGKHVMHAFCLWDTLFMSFQSVYKIIKYIYIYVYIYTHSTQYIHMYIIHAEKCVSSLKFWV